MTTPAPRHLSVTALEDRLVPASLSVRSYDGSGNNLTNPLWGTPGTDFLRLAPAEYGDGISTPAGADRPSARAISNSVADQGSQEILSDRSLSAMMYAWGQFIDHDLDSTKAGSTEAFNIAVPSGDPTFDPTGTGTATIAMFRSAFDPATGTTNPRQQVNGITAWLDGSMIYGSDTATANSLRAFTGGQMKTSAGNLLPVGAGGFYQAGDARANENPELTALQTLFVREHNRVAANVAKANPTWTDEQIFQKARAVVIAELQAITYNEWLPALTGTGLGPYRGYDPTANPAISTEFATAGFRFGHSMLGNDIEFLGNDGEPVAPSVELADAFFNPSLVSAHGIDPLLKYLASDPASEVDTKVVDSVRNLLLTVPGGTMTLDLASLNIQRGRDHGLSDYNATRVALGLPKVTDFSQITSNKALQQTLKDLYGSVDNIDLWVGGLAEDHVRGGSVGPTFRAIINEQFGRLRAADRFWYENTFTGAELQTLRNTKLSDVIARNSGAVVQKDAFFFRAEVSGTVFGDGNKDARRNPGEAGLGARTVQLVNLDTGAVVATKQTDPQGHFTFTVQDGVRTGRYTVRVTISGTELQTTPTDPLIVITAGDQPKSVDVGLAKSTTTPPPRPNLPPPAPHSPSAPPHLPAAPHPAGPPQLVGLQGGMAFDLFAPLDPGTSKPRKG